MTLAVAAALVLAFGALTVALRVAYAHRETARLLDALRGELTDLHRGRRRDRADLNRLFRWAHGADPDAQPAELPDPDETPSQVPHSRPTDPAPPAWADPAHMPDAPDRRAGLDRRGTDRRAAGAHRPPVDRRTDAQRAPALPPRSDEQPPAGMPTPPGAETTLTAPTTAMPAAAPESATSAMPAARPRPRPEPRP